MKNTKHTEKNDSSIEQDNQENLSQSKRKILTSIGVTSGVVGASALVPSTWVKPAVNSVILPAHAQSTPAVTTMAPDATTMAPDATTMAPDATTMAPDATTMAPDATTMAPDATTMAPDATTAAPDATTAAPEVTTPAPEETMAPVPSAGIVLSPSALGVVEGGTGDAFSRRIAVRLNTMPAGPVAVTTDPELETAIMLEFTTTDWDDDQVVAIPLGDAVAATADEDDMTITFMASGGGYDDVEAELTWTVGNFADANPTDVEAEGGVATLAIEWEAPDTRNPIARYIVVAAETLPGEPTNATVANTTESPFTQNVSASRTSYSFSNLPAGLYNYRVTAVYENGAGTDTFTHGTGTAETVDAVEA